jgi:hypothetical protein
MKLSGSVMLLEATAFDIFVLTINNWKVAAVRTSEVVGNLKQDMVGKLCSVQLLLFMRTG